MNLKDDFYEYMYNYKYEEYYEYYEYKEEIVNPVVEIIRRYDNFLKNEEKKHKAIINAEKIKKHKFAFTLVVYTALFIGVSIFKMNALYEIVDLNMKLGDINKKIFEVQKNINSIEYGDKMRESNVNLKKIENESKKMGFTDERKIEYIHFEK